MDVNPYLESHRSDSSGERECVLIVDDEPGMLAYLTELLSEHYRVDTAENGRTALRAIELSMPDIILSDYLMPDMDGLELLICLKSNPQYEKIPFILLSVREKIEDRLMGLKTGADDYIAKPFHQVELLLRIKNLLHRTILEKLSIHRERELIFANFHDHIGAALSDLSFLVEKLKKETNSRILPEFEESLKNLRLKFRESLGMVNDLGHLDRDFLHGLNAILLRRYTYVGRTLAFKYDRKEDEYLNSRENEKLRRELFAILSEVTTNDLKYGKKSSTCVFYLEGDGFHITFESETNHEKIGQNIGLGAINIERRVIRLGGEIQMKQHGGKFALNIKIPVKPS